MKKSASVEKPMPRSGSGLLKFSFNQQKTFRPKLSLWPGGASRFSLAGQLAETAVLSADLRQAVVCPPDYDLNEWLAVNMVDFFNQINLIYGNIAEFCTKQACPVMNAGSRYDYLWADGVTIEKPIKCSAPDYVSYLLAWVQSRFDDQELFPRSADTPFPPHFFNEVRTIFKRLFRVYAHMYYSHFKNIEGMGMDAVVYLNTCYKHFMLFIFRYSLVERKELEPLAAVTNKLLSSEEQVPALMSPSPLSSFAADVSSTGSEIPRSPSATSNLRSSANISVKSVIAGHAPSTKTLVSALKKVMIMPAFAYAPTEAEAKALSAATAIHAAVTDFHVLVQRPDVDVVFIAGPVEDRKALFLAAVGAGKHAVVEQPAGLSKEDLAEMHNAATQRQKRLDASHAGSIVFCSVNFPWRFLPTSRPLFFKDYCGDVVLLRAHLTLAAPPQQEQGAWTERHIGADTAALIDLMHFVTGLRMSSVHALLKKSPSTPDAVDTVTAQGVVGEGIPAQIYVSHSSSGPASTALEIYGAKGTLVLRDLALHGCQAPATELTPVATLVGSADFEEHGGTAAAGGFALMARALRALVVEKDEQILRDAASTADALYVQSVIDAIKRSIETAASEPVTMPALSQHVLTRSMSREDLGA